MFYTQEQIDRANRADIADFLRTQRSFWLICNPAMSECFC